MSLKKNYTTALVLIGLTFSEVQSSNVISESDLAAFNHEFSQTHRFEMEGGVFSFSVKNLPMENPGEYLRIDNVGKMTAAWELSYKWFLREVEKAYIAETDRLIVKCIEQKALHEGTTFQEARESFLNGFANRDSQTENPLITGESGMNESPFKKLKGAENSLVPLKYLFKDFAFIQYYSMPSSRVEVIWAFSNQPVSGLTPVEVFPSSSDFFAYIQNCFSQKVKEMLEYSENHKAKKTLSKMYL